MRLSPLHPLLRLPQGGCLQAAMARIADPVSPLCRRGDCGPGRGGDHLLAGIKPAIGGCSLGVAVQRHQQAGRRVPCFHTYSPALPLQPVAQSAVALESLGSGLIAAEIVFKAGVGIEFSPTGAGIVEQAEAGINIPRQRVAGGHGVAGD